MRWTSGALLLFLITMFCAVGLSYVSRQTTDRSTLRPSEIIDVESLEPSAEELDASDLKFDGFERIADVSYGPHGWRNCLDLYLPEQAQRPLPVIVYFHGAGTSGSSKDDLTPVTWAPPLLARSFAFVQTNYRIFSVNATTNRHGDKAFRFPAQLHDCRAAIRFLRANAAGYGLDPRRIGVMGHSFGGYLAAMVGTTGDSGEFGQDGLNQDQASAVQAACVVAGICDFSVRGQQEVLHSAARGYEWLSIDPWTAIGPELFGTRDIAVFSKGSPITYASDGDPPFLIIHGFHDIGVSPHQADMFYVRLRNAGVETTLHLIPGAGHGGPTLNNKHTRSTIADFFDRHLKKGR